MHFEDCVVQQYMPNPMLVDGCKFDLRVYVLVSSCDPLKVFMARYVLHLAFAWLANLCTWFARAHSWEEEAPQAQEATSAVISNSLQQCNPSQLSTTLCTTLHGVLQPCTTLHNSLQHTAPHPPGHAIGRGDSKAPTRWLT